MRHCICILIENKTYYLHNEEIFRNIYTVSTKRITDTKTRIPSDWESSPHTCDPNQVTAHAPGEIILILVIMWFLFEEVSSSAGCLGWDSLFYCGTP